ncbi:ADP-ribosyl-[dinitrogen reductase] glycohydrolase [bacterium HR29]|nr:ADP-ribosyl-[dinitrogen reductase] glycohydrolase [bacterium HR29]
MSAQRRRFEWLRSRGYLELGEGAVLARVPEPLPPNLLFDRVAGMLLGVAIGDALGNPSESMLPAERRRRFGEIRDYAIPQDSIVPRGRPSDDAQLTFRTVEGFVEDGQLDPDSLLRRFAGRRIRGIGSAVRAALQRYQQGVPWYEVGEPSAGNGALMRIAPALLLHLRRPSADLWCDTAVLAHLTHRDPASTASCIAFVDILWELLRCARTPDPMWWVERFVSTAAGLETRSYRPRGGPFVDRFEGPLSRFVEWAVPSAWRQRKPVLEACNGWYSGAYLLETVPSVLYILMWYADDPEEAVVRAVNDTRDNDTVAAIVGAAVGALHGAAAFPERWREGLPGEVDGGDPGRVHELVERVRAFVPAG